MSHVIGIDVGTSGIKVAAVGRDGRIEDVESRAYALCFPQPGWVEIDLEQTWELVHELLGLVSRKVADLGGEIEAVSLSCFCNASVFLDEAGRPLQRGILYMDQRSTAETEWVKAAVSEEERFRITKNRTEPGMISLTSLLWFKNNRPELFRRTRKWGHLSSYLLYRLTGRFVLDWTQASYSGMFDVEEYRWSAKLCGIYGIEESLLPEIVDPREAIGRVSDDCGLPFGGRVRVAAGAADTACSTLTLGLAPGQMFESVGTSDVLTICTDNPRRFDARFLNRCHILKGRWLSHGAMSTPGSSIRWFKENFLQAEAAADPGILENLVRSAPPGANGLFFLPYMFGERSPIWDVHARGSFVGLDLTSTKTDMLQAIYEGCAYGLRQIYEIMEEAYGLSFADFFSIGGGAQNRHWSQIKSNVLGKVIEVNEVAETAACGAALLAGRAVGFYADMDEGVCAFKSRRLFAVEPDQKLVLRYERQYRLFCELYPALRSFFAKAYNARKEG
ncbi:FGGY family carbohydrate kinase [uncultured Paenibacillus sp.]|uniref:xylulokinase n=1 Tax=uncultured Paenibacillus sp. TaxID=227322 RepID=UPI0028D5D00D|nr:FGGY family carbohydrate kinase [uncultured Paenibacillus sp.]